MEIRGRVSHIIYYNEENGYIVFQLVFDDEEYTCVGHSFELNTTDFVTLEGELVYNEKYGEQIAFSSLEFANPDDEESIKYYLINSNIPHIGEKRAEDIIKLFKEDSFRIIKEEPEKLIAISGLGKKSIEDIKEYMQENNKREKIIKELSVYKLSSGVIIKIYNAYKEDAVRIIKTDPYRLLFDKVGLSFKAVDELAIKTGMEKTCEERVKAAIVYLLSLYVRNGHSFSPKKDLHEKLNKLLDTDSYDYDDILFNLAVERRIKIVKEDDFEDFKIYLMSYYLAEDEIAKRVSSMLKEIKIENSQSLDNLIKEFEVSENCKLDPLQTEAIKLSFNNKISIITGGPGTGKTTIIKAIIYIAKKNLMSISLAAPTGRAAKRMQETTNHNAETIHRLLEAGTGSFFNRDESNPLESDIIIIDELSMVDIILMNNLLKAVDNKTSIILVGDKDQLPSVGAGNVLKDLIESDLIAMVELEKIFRQSENSMIAHNSRLIKEGRMPVMNKKDGDFFIIHKNKSEDIIREILELLHKRLKKHFSYDPFKDVAVLCPMKKGPLGTFNLNKRIQELLNPHASDKHSKIFMNEEFRVNDKIMQIKNNYEIKSTVTIDGRDIEIEGVYNGDTGIIKEINNDDKYLKIEFNDDKVCFYDFSLLDEIKLSYAITVHKSQGSEFKAVIIPLTYAHEKLLNRNLIYTAISRAKELVVLVGDEKYLKMMIDNDYEMKRFSSLSYRIIKYAGLFKNVIL